MRSVANINIRTDSEIKDQAEAVFSELGLDMTTAINLFLRATVREQGLPFELRVANRAETLAAVEEARCLAHDPHAHGYRTMKELRDAREA